MKQAVYSLMRLVSCSNHQQITIRHLSVYVHDVYYKFAAGDYLLEGLDLHASCLIEILLVFLVRHCKDPYMIGFGGVTHPFLSCHRWPSWRYKSGYRR